MLETSCMIMQTVQYEYVEETIGPDGRWVQNGQKGVMLFESYGSGVCLAQSAEGAYILTANHVVAPMEQTQTLPDLTGAMRRILTKISENTGIVISYSHDAEHNLIFETVPAEILASNEHDIALVRTSTPVAIHMGGRQFTLRTVNRTGSVSEGDTVFGIGYRILPRVESDYLNVNERLIRSFDVGFVKSIGDPNERSDDEINYISMNTQQGNSGGPVFNQNFELVGLRAHVFFTRTSNIEDMINAYAIRDFLQTSGYARLLQ
ncbi:MAG: trypsin-like peptidase domain-containing protein [Candidatus Aenigmarchaeota archaeon]|nr:trypsin-like peptidase domain-containing protein [Candidatus Aenigmarchaeota archaeon]